MGILRYNNKPLFNPVSSPPVRRFGQVSPYYTPTGGTPVTRGTPTPTPTVITTGPTPTIAPTPIRTSRPGLSPVVYVTPTGTPYISPPSYTPSYTGAAAQVNPEEAGLYPPGYIPGPTPPTESPPVDEAPIQPPPPDGGGVYPPPIQRPLLLPGEEEAPEGEVEEEPKKNWLVWLILAVGAYVILTGDFL